MLLESALVRAALCGVLSVDEGVVFLTILVGVCECYLDVFAFEVNDGVYALACHVVVEQVFQSVSAEYSASVVHDGEPGVEVSVVAQHGFHYLVTEVVVLKHGVVGFKPDVGAVFVVGLLCHVGLKYSACESCLSHLTLAVGAHLKLRAQGVYCLHAHTVEADAFLECLGVVFSTGIQHADGLDEFSLRYAASVVSHAHSQSVFDVYLDAFSGIHFKLVDRVVDNLF